MRQITPPAGRMGDLSRRVAITADPDTNALLITATDSDFETVAALIRAVAAPTDDRAWWCKHSGEERGPFTTEQIWAMLQTGEIFGDTLSRPEGEQEWTPISEQPVFREALEL